MIKALLFLAALISVLTTIGIVFALVEESIPFFADVGTRFFTDGEWTPLFSDPEYGIWPLLNGTLLITGIGILVAVPLGLGTAIYLSEYATPRVRRIVKPIIEVLVGVPTIVFGYFALTFVTPLLVQDLLGVNVQFNALAAGVVVGIMIMPTIASISEDAMSAVPQGLREGAYGLGAIEAPGRDPGRLPGGDLRDRRLDRARRLAGDRRDDDRPDRRRPEAEHRAQPD